MVCILLLFDIFNRSNFQYCAFSDLKEDSGKRKKKKMPNKKNIFQVGVNEHKQKKGG